MGDRSFREVFVFVAGITPQIVTETIYALAQKIPPVLPDELYIITTATGKKHVQETLTNRNILQSLFTAYHIPPVPLTEKSFIVARTHSDGRELDDIRDEKENEIMGNLITTFLQEKTRDRSTRLHCSIAGGRKTMSFYMGAALQLFGRPWDRLYHVLVSPEFESNPAFFYKPKKNKIIESRQANGTVTQFNTDNAKIHLAELPFIRLRDKLSHTGKNFRELVEEGQKEIDAAFLQPEILVSLSERSLRIGNTDIRLLPVQLALYSALLKRKIGNCSHLDRQYCSECSDCFVTPAEFFKGEAMKAMARNYDTIYSGRPSMGTELLAKWQQQEEPAKLFRQNISKLNASIQQQLNNDALALYATISTVKRYGESKYGIKTDKEKIRPTEDRLK
jgi:CRISPR-associated protein (TIGR02584 family)